VNVFHKIPNPQNNNRMREKTKITTPNFSSLQPGYHKVLKTFEIFLHQITPEAIIRMGVFICAMRSQGLEPSAKCFCNMHELLYETKATGKEQYHNNFGCYDFVPRPDVSYPVPTFRKRWPEAWMEEWFYVKNNLIEREDIKGIIQHPIWSRFGIRRPATALGNDIETCQRSFNTVCTFIGTRDLVQEHIAYKVWSFVNEWKMPKEAAAGSSQGGLVYLKYTFRYKGKFDEPNDEWLSSIEATSEELLGAYTRAEDDAMALAFEGRGKKRLNRVFDVIGFVYPDYCYPSRKQGKKRKIATSAISVVLKGKKIKVLTHPPRYIETTIVSKLGEGTSFAVVEAEQPAPTILGEDLTKLPKVPEAGPVETPEHDAEAKEKAVKEPEPKLPKILSPPAEAELPKVAKAPTTAPTRRRMASVLDAVMETTRALTPAPMKKVTETATTRADIEAGPSVPTGAEPAVTEQIAEQESPDTGMALEKKDASEKLDLLLPKHYPKILTLLFDMLWGKSYLKKKSWKPNTTPGN
jgi:hypothetical protein